ncbi:MAG: NAD/NADP octopine/nopaline dehydrogenase family protein [Deltaproteobacteria bacterium]|jgi:opine dehydrogenase|nr:NAD/NADP octopine/nopaline dehydrogenase family protein [Deltaproteobacteria bacterium]
MEKRIIAVLGCGNGAHVMAADLKLKGHIVRLYETPAFRGQIESVFETKTISVTGALKGTVTLDLVTDEIERAVEGAHYVLVVTPAFAHAHYARLLKGKLHGDQMVIVFPGAFASLVFRREFGGEDCPILAEANHLPYDARLTGPGRVNLFDRNKINIAFLPNDKSSQIIGLLRDDLFPFEKLYADVLECGLSLVNPTLHAGPCLLNIGNIERPDVNFFIYDQGITPSSAKIDIALDQERKALGRKFGYDLTSLEEFTNLPRNFTWKDFYRATHGDVDLTPIAGPNDIFNRYLTEDAPYGLVPWAAIGRLVGVDMPVTNGVIDIYNVIHERDWRSEGNNATKLGLEGLGLEEIQKYVTSGNY